MNLSASPLTTSANSTQAHWGIRVVLCLLLCWTVFQGVQNTAQVHTTRTAVACFGACGLDAVMDAEVSLQATNPTPTCNRDALWPCENDDSDGDVLVNWNQSISVATLVSHLTPLVPAHGFEHTPLRKPPRHGA